MPMNCDKTRMFKNALKLKEIETQDEYDNLQSGAIITSKATIPMSTIK